MKKVLLSLGLMIGTSSSAVYAGIIDTLYVTDGDAARLAIIHADDVSASTYTTFVRGYPIAVRDSGSVWIADFNGPNPSQEFDLSGNPTGATAAYSPVSSLDGAVNGSTKPWRCVVECTVHSANAD
jgi:hypothetical protein